MNTEIMLRQILINQYEILAKLNPREEEFYNLKIEMLQRGYKSLYMSEIFGVFESELSDEQFEEVTNIMNMFRAIVFSYRDLPDLDKKDIDAKCIWFPGFDGNNEGKYEGFAEFFIEEMGRFQELKHPNRDYNIHRQMLDKYKLMLSIWNDIEVEKKFKLSKDDIKNLIGDAFPRKNF